MLCLPHLDAVALSSPGMPAAIQIQKLLFFTIQIAQYWICMVFFAAICTGFLFCMALTKDTA
ncbi:hypothetical protein DT73_14215 [Mangrovibacter sp. MFB070]|nr:hypothetical protein DT73_14215 [Mangrovibacter sp. MFB070]